MTNTTSTKAGTRARSAAAIAAAAVGRRLQVRAARTMPVNAERVRLEAVATSEESAQCVVPAWLQKNANEASTAEEGEDTVVHMREIIEKSVENSDEDEDEEDEEDEVNSSSSFSLQECINQFHARRTHRISAQSREAVEKDYGVEKLAIEDNYIDTTDAELIKQNRSNKEQERKCKPCMNGFCYCFTSDSGDGDGCGGGCVGTRGAHVRQARRSRKSESTQASDFSLQNDIPATKVEGHKSAPAYSKNPEQLPNLEYAHTQEQKAPKHLPTNKLLATPCTVTSGPQELTAISRLRTASDDAPLIHIIQELHDNCVISEVRINKSKIRSRSLSAKPSPKKSAKFFATEINSAEGYVCTPPLKQFSPSAPALDKISEMDSALTGGCGEDGFTTLYSSPLNNSSKSNETSNRRKHKAAGRLLQKRLGHAHNIQFKPRNLTEPPPKPPRSSLGWGDKCSVTSLASTSTSVREAERIVDTFLRNKGVKLPGVRALKQKEQISGHRKSAKFEAFPTACKEPSKREKRNSYPLTRFDEKLQIRQQPMPSCPSLSDLERVVDANKSSPHCRNINKPVKELSFGWKEPKIVEMLSYDNNANHKEFRSQGSQAEPQSEIGWTIPPKVELDTVDGSVRHNLASNIEQKHTPVKARLFSTHKSKKRNSHGFFLSEHLRNLSPWAQRNSTASGQRSGKSNMKVNASTRNFLSNSKKKILRLVSPKKENKERRNLELRSTPLPQRNVAVQTSYEDFRPYENSSTPHSPPGSYHSAVQTSQQSTGTPSTLTQNITPAPKFDFSRTVHSPPKKAPRATQRRLNFSLNCVGSTATADMNDAGATMTKTYRSFQTGLDQDAALSKMGYILSNIRAKLEASDEHAIRTFQEIERREQQSVGFDCVDGATRFGPKASSQLQSNVRTKRLIRQELELPEPIYSEIEEDSIHISGSPQFDNKTGIQHFSADRNPEALYAKVQKNPKTQFSTVQQAPTSLGQLLHDSLRNLNITPTKPLPAEPDSSDVSYTSPQTHDESIQSSTDLPHCASLNNVRVQEHNSPPKHNRNLSKSDLSLQRSDIFLENFCRSEIVIEHGELERLEKVDNITTSQPTVPEDNVSYELPIEVAGGAESVTYAAGSQVDLNAIAAPDSRNQSTPKKQTFLTKLLLDEQQQQLSVDISSDVDVATQASHLLHNQSYSCPTTPAHLQQRSLEVEADHRQHAVSLNEVYSFAKRFEATAGSKNSSNNNNDESANTLHTSTWSKYKRLKDALRKSLRKSKDYMRNESKRLSTSLNVSAVSSAYAPTTVAHNQTASNAQAGSSSFDLDILFALEQEQEHAPVQEQLAKAVSICRQLPDIEVSLEMVEAERLLLYSTLRHEAKRQRLSLAPKRRLEPEHTQRFYVDDMRLPVKANASQDLFFNYFYICTFECGGIVRSTQSVECHNYEAIFRDCGIEFSCGNGSDQQKESEISVQCQVFMLRLRKVSTLSLEPRKATVKMPLHSPTSSQSSTEEIVSRFRLHASFVLRACDFVPYEYVECASKDTQRICLRAAHSTSIPLTRHSKSSNLTRELVLNGRAEVLLPEQRYAGFLNVQDPKSKHNWNRRWCVLEQLQLRVWQDEQQLTQQPLMRISLRVDQTAPLTAAPPELCARPRSFCLQCLLTKESEREAVAAAVLFAADTQVELNAWLQHLNALLNFMTKWMWVQ